MQNARFTAHNYECTTHREPEFWNYCRVETSATTRVSEWERQKHDGEDEKFGRKGQRERERERNRQKGKELWRGVSDEESRKIIIFEAFEFPNNYLQGTRKAKQFKSNNAATTLVSCYLHLVIISPVRWTSPPPAPLVVCYPDLESHFVLLSNSRFVYSGSF